MVILYGDSVMVILWLICYGYSMVNLLWLLVHNLIYKLAALIYLLGLGHCNAIIGMADLPNVLDGGAAEVEVQANGAHAWLTWTSVMSGFILRRFSDFVGQGLKTDKGFKEVHLNVVARDLSEFANVQVTGNQVYNHLGKWRTRRQKICRLKELSGANWDEQNFMITLDANHYNGHVKVCTSPSE